MATRPLSLNRRHLRIDLSKIFIAMGRRRIKKTCSSCGFSHGESAKECVIPQAIEEELKEASEELIGATGGESPVNSPSPAQSGPNVTSSDAQIAPNSRPSQATLMELASMENRMNSRMEKFEALVVNLVSGAPPTATAAAEAKSAPPPAPESKQPRNYVSRRPWGDCDSSDSDEETGSKSNKEKKKEKRRFRHKNFLQRGESVMMVTFRTMLEMQDDGEELSGILAHGLLLSEKSSKGVYKYEALLSYDESVRKRAGREGVSEFGNVKQEEVMRHFCFDNSIATDQKKASKPKSNKNDKVCLRYNGDEGCSVKNCFYAHRCLACDDPGHPKRECKNLMKKQSDK